MTVLNGLQMLLYCDFLTWKRISIYTAVACFERFYKPKPLTKLHKPRAYIRNFTAFLKVYSPPSLIQSVTEPPLSHVIAWQNKERKSNRHFRCSWSPATTTAKTWFSKCEKSFCFKVAVLTKMWLELWRRKCDVFLQGPSSIVIADLLNIECAIWETPSECWWSIWNECRIQTNLQQIVTPGKLNMLSFGSSRVLTNKILLEFWLWEGKA